MSSSDEQEQTPLVYSLHVENSGEPLAERSSSVSNGATSILSRFPTNLSRPWHAVAYIVGLLLISTITILIMYFFTTALVPAAFPIPRAISKRSADFCDLNELEVELSDFLSPRETQIKFASDERRIFFVKRSVENLTEANICALMSAARVGRVYLIVILPPVTALDERLLSQASVLVNDTVRGAGLDRDVGLLVANAAGVFSETPLSGFDDDEGSRRQELKDFAFKVMIAWRYGGAAYDLDLVTVVPTTRIEPRLVSLKSSQANELKNTLYSIAKPNSFSVMGHEKMASRPKMETDSRDQTLMKLSTDLETVTLNKSPEVDPWLSLKASSTVKTLWVTLEPSTKSEILKSAELGQQMVKLEHSVTPDDHATVKASTRSEPDAVALHVSPSIESTIMALDDYREMDTRSASWQASLTNKHDGNATVSLDGSILIARQPCHAFVFALMRELVKSALSPIPEDVTVSMVVERALDSFCNGVRGGCNGIKVVPKDKICARDDELAGGSCEWVRAGSEGKARSQYCL